MPPASSPDSLPRPAAREASETTAPVPTSLEAATGREGRSWRTQHFLIHFTEQGPHAVDPTPATPGQPLRDRAGRALATAPAGVDVPSFVWQLGVWLEEALRRFLALGFAHPVPDPRAPQQVLLLAEPSRTAPGAPMVIHTATGRFTAEGSAPGSADDVDGPAARLAVTAAHELFHQVQYRYLRHGRPQTHLRSYQEGTARCAERWVAEGHPRYLVEVRRYLSPQVGYLQGLLHPSNPYRTVAFWMYLIQQLPEGAAFLARLWEQIAETGAEGLLPVQALLGEEGLAAAFDGFVLALTGIGLRDLPAAYVMREAEDRHPRDPSLTWSALRPLGRWALPTDRPLQLPSPEKPPEALSAPWSMMVLAFSLPFPSPAGLALTLEWTGATGGATYLLREGERCRAAGRLAGGTTRLPLPGPGPLELLVSLIAYAEVPRVRLGLEALPGPLAP